MTVGETTGDIQDQAARWAIRLDEGALGRPDQEQLDAWLAADVRRRGALMRARAGLHLILENGATARAPTAGLPLNRRTMAGGFAAMAAAAVGAIALPSLLGGRRYRTDVGESRRVPLADGSLAAINTDTEIDVAFDDQRRAVRLDRGEAWFQVAKDPARPFVVAVGEVQVRAVGTAFSVRRRAMGVEVLVTEGVVEVSNGNGVARKVSSGNRIFVRQNGAPARPLHRPLEMDRALAWRQGQIALDGDTVSAAVAEFNRHNARKIVITDPRLEGRRVVGWFHTNEPESFARAVALSEGADINVSGDAIMLGG